jgi:hypothetical protein
LFSVDGLIDQALVGADNLQKIRTDADLGNATYLYNTAMAMEWNNRWLQLNKSESCVGTCKELGTL